MNLKPFRPVGMMVGGAVALAGALHGESVLPPTVVRPAFVSRANTPPRKIVIASAVVELKGSLAQRVQFAAKMIDDAAREAAGKYAGRGLDLVVFPEFSLQRASGPTAVEQAVSLDDPALETLTAKARELHTWIVMPMTLREPGTAGAADRFSNAAVLFNREGKVAGIFRKVHPIADDKGIFEGGISPGEDYPVFDCDFGKLGILICWDMSYEEVWDALGARGAEIVALPTASPQNVQPAAQARRHNYYVVNSAPRNNVTVFDPIGRIVAQVTSAPGMVVQQIDLAYAILHWSETLRNGQALTDRYGAKAGYSYSDREDTGIAWSNDASITIGTMIRELGLHEYPVAVELMEAARLKALKK